ncbi:D-alanyl-lipoteichoic acid biosynthesis protein DltD [Lacticaseibacillus mingshuiensis]|uniref:D-alanyl-lipoteichoic acid biosynthesis protein DltD n=1 Tax=Lacticaseibacillus mingshuiensis TaxID=2799574 RepID=UPI001951B62D|nr:D-alanyl-lipoteichoic acid biosynthesis protein DltD [Lacticaseibacillus mingshuiensis]
MKKKLWQIFGPIAVAFALVAVILVAPLPLGNLNRGTIERAAVSLSPDVLAGQRIKHQAVQDGYVPFFGSSELSRMDTFHPSVLAAKYDRNYRPLLLGAPGTQSLTHFIADQTMIQQLAGKKAVVILSLQWFTKMGQMPDAFAYYFSPMQTIEWLRSAEPKRAADVYAAHRLLKMPVIRDNATLYDATKDIAAGQPISSATMSLLDLRARLLNNEDALFSRYGFKANNLPKIEKAEKQLPAAATYPELNALADKIAAKATSNNDLGIDNHFYSTRLAGGKIDGLKDSQVRFDYRRSPEYGDLELLLEQFARYHVDVQFVIPPINQKWATYTGLSQSMIKTAANKVKHQLTSQGFDRVQDLTQDGKEKYFMQDTIHLGWRGWVKVDETVAPFLEDKQEKPVYHINHHYYSAAWANATSWK